MHNIQVTHMKHRCQFIYTMCCVSLFGWYNHSLFDPINNLFLTPHYQNGLLFLFYLGWDTYHMIRTPVLFRTDLMIHHPCGKQHFREIATPDWVSQFTNLAYG